MKHALWIIVLAIIVRGTPQAVANEPNTHSYILVDIEKVGQPEIKGLSGDGSLTIARYDPAANDIAASAHKLRGGKESKYRDRVLVVRSPVQKMRSTKQFILEVEPGMWIIESANGTVFTKGSWMFEVPEGTVVDLGVFKPVIGWRQGDKRESLVGAVATYAITGNDPKVPNKRPKSRPIHLEWHKRLDADMPLPPSVGAAKVVEASFKKAKFQNYLTGLLNLDGFTNCIDASVPAACDD